MAYVTIYSLDERKARLREARGQVSQMEAAVRSVERRERMARRELGATFPIDDGANTLLDNSDELAAEVSKHVMTLEAYSLIGLARQECSWRYPYMITPGRPKLLSYLHGTSGPTNAQLQTNQECTTAFSKVVLGGDDAGDMVEVSWVDAGGGLYVNPELLCVNTLLDNRTIQFMAAWSEHAAVIQAGNWLFDTPPWSIEAGPLLRVHAGGDGDKVIQPAEKLAYSLVAGVTYIVGYTLAVENAKTAKVRAGIGRTNGSDHTASDDYEDEIVAREDDEGECPLFFESRQADCHAEISDVSVRVKDPVYNMTARIKLKKTYLTPA